jgi:PAS domain S-box-containing protein
MKGQNLNSLDSPRNKEQLYQKMVEEVEDYAILLLDREGYVLNWNKGAEKIKGYKAEEIIGRSFSVFYTEEARKTGHPLELIQKARDRGKAMEEGWRVRKDGTTFWGSIVITALHDEENQVIGFTKVTRDLTERKLAEDKLRQHLRQLEFQNRELEQFAYVASHDLQEPLRTITSFVGLLDESYRGKLDPEADRYLRYVLEASERMRDLIKALLDYSRLGRERILETVDCQKILEEVVSDLHTAIQETNAIIRAESLPTVSAFPTELKLLFQNLISNAIKFRKNTVAPEITVEAEKKGGGWEFSVADNGIGIEEKFLEKIFVIFQRLHPRTKYEGTGIGLAHCKKIAGLHGGEIWAKSEPGKGSTFYFTLKAIKMDQKLDCVLLIDDDEPTNFLNERILKKVNFANKIRSVQTAREALNSIAYGDGGPRPDLIFLDINMPGLNGWDFLEEYSKLPIPEEEKAVIVMLTSSFNPDDRKKASEMAEVAAFESKPLTETAVKNILKKFF